MALLLDVHLREVNKARGITAFSVAALTLAVNVFVLLRCSVTTYTTFYPLFVQIPMFIVFSLLTRYKGMKLFFILLSAIIFTAPPIVISMTVASFFQYNALVQMLVRWLCYPVMIFLVIRFFKPMFSYMLEYCDKGWGVYTLVPLVYYLLTFLTSRYNFTADFWSSMMAYRIGLTVLIFTVYILILTLFKRTREQMISQAERDLFCLQATAAADKLYELNQSQEKTLEYRHDMRHHLAFLQGLASQGNMEGIKEFLSAAESYVDAITPTRYCENNTVNLILSSFAAKARQANVALTADLKLPKTLHIKDTELCSLLSNGLENAICAAGAIPEPTGRMVSVKAWVQKEKLMIAVENPYSGTVTLRDGLPLSSQEGHGYGARSMAAIAHAHGGLVKFTADNGLFMLRLMLPLAK